MKKSEIGKCLVQRRKALKINQRDLAELCGVSVHAIGNLERGIGNPTFDLLQRVCDAMGLELRLAPKILEGGCAH